MKEEHSKGILMIAYQCNNIVKCAPKSSAELIEICQKCDTQGKEECPLKTDFEKYMIEIAKENKSKD